MTTAAICATQEVSWSPSFYRGEQFDSDLGLYYLRARYYNPNTGRFLSRDPKGGNGYDPKTLHKYLYASGDPVNRIDPSGRGAYSEFVQTVKVALFVLATDFKVQVATAVGTFILVKWIALPFFEVSEILMNYLEPPDEGPDTE